MLPAVQAIADDSWRPLDEIAALTDLSIWTLRRRARTQWAPKGLAELRPPRNGHGRPTWWICGSCQAQLRLLFPPDPERQARESTLARYPANQSQCALRKGHWLRAWRDRVIAAPAVSRIEHARAIVAEAKRVEGPDYRISVRSLQAWQAVYDRHDPATGHPRGLLALLPAHSTPQTIGPPDSASSFILHPSSLQTRSPAAIDYYYSMYHSPQRHSIRLCHDATCRQATQCGWRWPADYSATTRWLKRTYDVSLTYLIREGKDAWARRYLPHLEMDWTAVEPGEYYVCDHHQVDFWATYRGQQIRPWLTAIQDCRSRAIVGWHLGPTPHQDAILAALRGAYRDWAIPRVMRVDNGKDFTSKLITGLTKSELRALRREHGRDYKRILRRTEHLVACEDDRWLGIAGELGIELIFAIPYSPWSKGTLERWFGTFEGQCGKTVETYCGNTPRHRPECLPELRAGAGVPTLEDARARIAEYLEWYHRRAHRGDGMDGRSPLAVWQTAEHLRRALADELAFLMDLRGDYRVTANGVRLTVGGASITYGARSAALRRHVGRKVLIALDPAHVGECWAYTPDRAKRRLIGRLDANQRIHPDANTDDVRAAIAETQRDKSVMHKQSRAAARRVRTANERINAHQRAALRELRATGTDSATPAPPPIIRPVRTGFEGVSRPVQSAGVSGPAIAESDDLDDLFAPEIPADTQSPEPDRDSDLSDFFRQEPAADYADDGDESDEGDDGDDGWEALCPADDTRASPETDFDELL